MHIDGPQREKIQQGLGKQLPICHHDGTFRSQRSQFIDETTVPDAFRLIDWNPGALRNPFHGRRNHTRTTASRTVRLGDGGQDGSAVGDKALD